jgi:hypothetical protein
MPNAFPNSPKLLRGGIVTLKADGTTVDTVIALQYNSETLTRSFQIQSTPGGQDGVRVDVFRLRGPAIETIKLDTVLDATDQLECPNKNPTTTHWGLHPQLAQLEMLINPSSQILKKDDDDANQGTLEIVPAEQPLTLFVWSQSRVVPIRITEFSITEEAFDVNLNPIRAKVSLGMRVLNVDDLGFSSPGGGIFMSYLKNKERLASQATNAAIGVLGLTGIP